MEKKITIKQIATDLDLSVSTVSKALNDSYEISESTKSRVLSYASANNYSPNQAAQNLKTGRTNTIGIVVCAINNVFISQILDGIYSASAKSGFDVIIMQSNENIDEEKRCLLALLNKGVDGILLAPVSENSNTDFLIEINKNVCPIVLFDRFNHHIETIKVGSNEYEGILNAVTHLKDIGRQNILFITGNQFGEENLRIKIFKEVLKEINITFREELMLRCDLANHHILDQQIATKIEELQFSGQQPDAIFGATDFITIRSLGILKKLNIRVPEDIAVIGFSNFDMVYSLNPPLSAIRQPAKEIGHIAFLKLIEFLNCYISQPSKLIQNYYLDTKIDFRESTGL